jgi:Xaa-Pro aminopeptidase
MHDRLERLRNLMREHDLDAVLVTHPANRFYLTGFLAHDHGPGESAGHVIVSQQRAIIVTSPLEVENAGQQAPDVEIASTSREMPGLARNDAEILREISARRIGFEEGAITYKDAETIMTHAGEDIECIPCESEIAGLRTVKSPDEVEALARALRITDEAFEQVAPTIAAGETERAVAWRIEQAVREHGGEGLAFPTIVASGPNAALPHARASDRAIQEGEPIVIDMGAYVDGYCGDLTRTVWVGNPDERLKEVYPIVLNAQLAALEGLKAGKTGKEVDAIARDIIAEAGFGDRFIHSLGHGLGVEVHEAPSLSPRYDKPLPAGSVVTIEPGIYIPGWGGVRIEDVGLITEEGVRNFTTASKRAI